MRQFIIDFIANNLIFVVLTVSLVILLSLNSRFVRRLLLLGLGFAAIAILVYELNKFKMVDDKSYKFICELIVILLVAFENTTHILLEINSRFSDKFNLLLLVSIVYYGLYSLRESGLANIPAFSFIVYNCFEYISCTFKKILNFAKTKISNIKNFSISSVTLRC